MNDADNDDAIDDDADDHICGNDGGVETKAFFVFAFDFDVFLKFRLISLFTHPFFSITEKTCFWTSGFELITTS